MRNIKRRHHYIPKAYLKGFCDEAGQIWIYDKSNLDNVVHNSPSNTAVKNKFYHLEQSDKCIDINAIEDFIAKYIEGPASKPLKYLKSKKFPNVDDKKYLANYFGLLIVRTPLYIQHFHELLNNYSNLDELVKMKASNKDRFYNDCRKFDSNITDVDIEKMRSLILEEEVKVEVHRNYLLKKLIHFSQIIGESFFNMNWNLIETNKNYPFIISDNTLKIFNKNLAQIGLFTPGVGLPNTRIFIPICSSLCLVLINDAKSKDKVIYSCDNPPYSSDGTRVNLNQLVRSINKFTFLMCDRYIFANSNSDKLKRLFKNMLSRMSKK